MFKQFSGGRLDSNTYVVWNELPCGKASSCHEAMIIDAGCRVSELKPFIIAENLKIKYIVLTHGHYDHVCFVEDYLAAFPDAKLVCHEDECKVLSDPEANVSSLFGDPHVYPCGDIKVKEGSSIILSGVTPGGNASDDTYRVMHTPGHTPGGICLFNEARSLLFTGDTLFAGGYGRTDFKYGSGVDLMQSLRRILAMDEHITFYSGHGEMAKIGWERY